SWWSHTAAWPVPPLAVTVRAAVPSRSCCPAGPRPVRYTVQPAAPSATATPLPTPLLAPVTSATLPPQGCSIGMSIDSPPDRVVRVVATDGWDAQRGSRSPGRVLLEPQVRAEHLVVNRVGGHAHVDELTVHAAQERQWATQVGGAVGGDGHGAQIHVTGSFGRVARSGGLVEHVSRTVRELAEQLFEIATQRMVLRCRVRMDGRDRPSGS